MNIKLKNKDLINLFNAINSIQFNSMKLARSKRKFLKRLEEKYSDHFEAGVEVCNEYVEIDKDGKYRTNKKGYVVKKDKSNDDFIKEMSELQEEEIVIEFGEFESQFKDLFESISVHNNIPEMNYEQLSILDNILEQYESQKGDE